MTRPLAVSIFLDSALSSVEQTVEFDSDSDLQWGKSYAMRVSREVDKLCDEFEAAWTGGRTPDLRGFVARISADERGILLTHLIPLDVEYRARREQPIDPEQYAEWGTDAVELARKVATDCVDNQGGDAGEHAGVNAHQPTVIHDEQPLVDEAMLDSVRAEESTIPQPREEAAGRSAEPLPRLGRYHVVQELSSGGQGRVYRAVHPNMPLEVAIKVSVNTADAATHAALIDESRILCDLQHPGIARILDVDFDEQNHPFVVLEFVRGLSLQQKLRSARFGVREAVELVTKLAGALEYAHQRGVLHLDLKPGNIVFNELGEPKIIDFGLARLQNAWIPEKTSDFQISGTPAYMSPEQASGRQDLVDARSDEFSLAAMLHEILTGKRLYSGETIQQIRAAQRCEFSPDPLLAAEIPKQLREVCLKALKSNPHDRYPSVAEFASELVKSLSTIEPDQPSSLASSAGAEDAKRSQRFRIATAAVSLFVILGAVWFKTSQTDSQTDNEPQGQAQQPADVPAAVGVDPPGQTADQQVAPRPIPMQTSIMHYSIDENGQIASSSRLMWEGIPRLNDFLRWDVDFEEPAFVYLIALNPDGVVQDCFPAGGQPQAEALSKLAFPASTGRGFRLTDGTGQQAFLLIASSQPLPALANWRKEIGLEKWDPSNESGLWQWKDGRLESFEANRFRGEIADLPGQQSFREICERITAKYPDVTLYGVSFPVDEPVVDADPQARAGRLPNGAMNVSAASVCLLNSQHNSAANSIHSGGLPTSIE